MRKLCLLFAALLVFGSSISVAAVKADEALVSTLATLFKGLTETQIDGAVAEAKNQLMAQAKRAQRNDLEKLFDAQIATLKDRGAPKQIVEIFQSQKGTVLKKARETTFGYGNIPFLPVIPRLYQTHLDLMAMVRNGSKTGRATLYLDSVGISDTADTPQEPYYIYDVDNGSSTLGKSPKAAEKLFKQQKRSGLTVAEVIALAVHTDVLLRHNVWAVGSRRGDLVANVWLIGGGPRLDWDWASSSGVRWGSASCGSR